MINKVLIVYYSLGGNTEVVASHIKDSLQVNGREITSLSLNRKTDLSELNIEKYDLVFLGSPTYNRGNTPKIVLDFLRYIIKNNEFSLPSFAVFGTGDTQWGSNLYCRAVDEMEYHLNKKTKVVNTLKIEQRPMSNHQINKIHSFVEETIGRF